MGAVLIVPKGTVIDIERKVCFQYKDDPYFNGTTFNGGYAFDADEQGNPIAKNEDQVKSIDYALHSGDYINMGIIEREIYSTFDLYKCKCGEEFYMTSHKGSNCPKCNQWYNYFGQEILPPEYWWNEM